MPFKPTTAMRNNALRAKRLRDALPPSRRGMTSTGLARMRQLIARRTLSDRDVMTMRAWFARHAVDKQGKGFRPGTEGYPSKGLQAWLGWGGDSGRSQVERWAKQIERDREG